MSTEDSQALLDYMLEPTGPSQLTPHAGKPLHRLGAATESRL